MTVQSTNMADMNEKGLGKGIMAKRNLLKEKTLALRRQQYLKAVAV